MVAFRATPEELARWRAAAGGSCTLSDFVRTAANRDAAWAEDAAAAYRARTAAPAVPIEDRADALRRGDLAALVE